MNSASSALWSMIQSPATEARFSVPAETHYFSELIARLQALWIHLGRLESDLLLERIQRIPIVRPVYVTGLARSGSTILLELLASCAGVTSHRYKDFPPLYTPYWWNWLLAHLPSKTVQPIERTHRDGMMITPESPEALEEVLWMAFFPRLHDPSVSNVLNEYSQNTAFESFYQDHIRKLLLVRRAQRYVSKANYSLTRLRYLLKLHPDARFVIPVRGPTSHIASLMKQHTLFCEGESRNPRMLEHMRRAGHFEFGLDRRPINPGDDNRVNEIRALWSRGHEVEGWARYWNLIYSYLADELAASPVVREAALVVRFEDLCARPAEIVRALFTHCDLEEEDNTVSVLASRIGFPTYYKADFSETELAQIERETCETARRFGY